MHKQIRVVPARSPADLQAFLEVLAAERINIEAAGGSTWSRVASSRSPSATARSPMPILLRDARYQPRELEDSVESEDRGSVHDVLDDR